jgi:translation initiation factor eIF-2B subunit delta
LPQHRPPAAAAAAALAAAAAGAGGRAGGGGGGGAGGGGVHPAVLRLGLHYASGAVSGGAARAAALLAALRCVVADYTTPPGKVLARDLTGVVNGAVAFLVECRPLSASMGAAVKALKFALSSLDPATPDDDARAALLSRIDAYVSEKIEFAATQLAGRAAEVILSVAAPTTPGGSGGGGGGGGGGGPAGGAPAYSSAASPPGFAATDAPASTGGGSPAVILTYGHSAAVAAALAETHRRAPGAVRVIVVDARPALEGRAMLAALRAAGLGCTYVQLASLGYVMHEVTAVALGAAAVLANGVVLGRAGSAAVALAATQAGRPVLVLCETHKFQDRVQLDSITTNELRDPDELARLGGGNGDGGAGFGDCGGRDWAGWAGGAPAAPPPSSPAPLADWRSLSPRLSLLNLAYDACPADCVTAVVTELGAMPPTSVPVVLREFRQEPQGL